MIKVSIIILNLNGAKYTIDCINSIKKNKLKDIEIVVLDNGSTDNSISILRKVKGIRLIENKVNLGFAGGNNKAVRYARGKYVALLNNDTLVHKDWLVNALKVLESNDKIGIVNPKSFDRYGKKSYQMKGYGTVSLIQTPVQLPFIKKSIKKDFPLLCASGFAIYKKSLLKQPFDSDYFAYSEDTYLGWLMNLKGYKVMNVPRSIVYHEGCKTSSNMKVPKNFFRKLAERNRYLNMLLFYDSITLIKLIPYFITLLVFTNIYDLKRFFMRISIYFWLIGNFKTIIKKRRKVQKQRKAEDKEIVKYLSYKVYDENLAKNKFTKYLIKSINGLFYIYCYIVNLRTIEFYQSRNEE